VWVDIVEFARGVQNVHTRHGNVENDEIGVYFGGAFDGIESVRGFAAYFKARSLQQGADYGANGRIIVNNEDAVWHAAPWKYGVTTNRWRAPNRCALGYQTRVGST
jgi:hypothetical protein